MPRSPPPLPQAEQPDEPAADEGEGVDLYNPSKGSVASARRERSSGASVPRHPPVRELGLREPPRSTPVRHPATPLSALPSSADRHDHRTAGTIPSEADPRRPRTIRHALHSNAREDRRRSLPPGGGGRPNRMKLTRGPQKAERTENNRPGHTQSDRQRLRPPPRSHDRARGGRRRHARIPTPRAHTRMH
jgi:hypothetical protein